MTFARPLLFALSMAVTPMAASEIPDGCLSRAIARCDAALDPANAFLTPLRGWCYLVGLQLCQAA